MSCWLNEGKWHSKSGSSITIIIGASLKRAPQLRVDLAFCHDIIGIDGPTSLWPGARRQGGMLRAKSSRRNFVWERSSVLVHAYVPSHSSSNSSLIELNCRSLAFAFDCQLLSALNHSAKNNRTSEKCHQVKEAGTFFCLRASRNRNVFFRFPIYLPIEKAYSTKQRYYCNSLSCKLLPQLIDSSATKGFFFDRQLSYSCLSHSSSVLAANDCRVVLTFFHRSPSFSLASASRVQHDNESWHARQRVYLTNSYNLNSYDSRTRAWADVFTKKKTRTTFLVNRLWFFRSFCIKSRAGEFSRS